MTFFERTESLLLTRGLIFSEGSSHGRPHTSDLFAAPRWTRASDADTEEVLSNRDPARGFVSFDASSLAPKIHAAYASFERNVSGVYVFPRELVEALHAIVNAATDSPVPTIACDAVVLESDGAGGMSGTTTNGLHFDVGVAESSLRIGVNLGPIPRRVIFVSQTKQEILRAVYGSDVEPPAAIDYRAISKLDLTVHACLVPPGQGWVMTTATRLHDGRRAVENGRSAFVLFRAEGAN